MSCPIYTAGDLKPILLAEETIFATTPMTKFKYGGDQISCSGGPSDPKINAYNVGALTYDGTLREAVAYGFESTFNVTGDWSEWVKLAIGDLNAIQRDIPSFSAYMKINVLESRLFAGCKINNLTLTSGGFGKLIEFKASVMSAICQESYDGTFKEPPYQTVTPDVTYTKPTGTIVIDTEDLSYSDGGVEKYIGAKTWTLSIDNVLTGVPGYVGGEMVANGECLIPGQRNITLSCTIQQGSETWYKRKMRDGGVFTLIIPIGKSYLELEGCEIIQADVSSRIQGLNDETLTFRAKDISYHATAINGYEVTTSVDLGGTVAVGESGTVGLGVHKLKFDDGSSNVLTATAQPGYTFVEWVRKSGSVSTPAITVTASESVKATFRTA